MERSTIIGSMNSFGSTIAALGRAARDGASQVAAFAQGEKATKADLIRFQNNVLVRMMSVGRRYTRSGGPARYNSPTDEVRAAKRADRYLKQFKGTISHAGAKQIIAEAPGHIREKFAVLKRLQEAAA